MKGEVNKVRRGGKFYFEIRRSPTTDGSSIEFIWHKKGSSAKRNTRRYFKRKVVIQLTYNQVKKRLNLKSGDKVIFQYRVRNPCGVQSKSSSHTYNYRNGVFVH